MRTLIAIYMTLFSTLAYGQGQESVMKCQMSIIRINEGEMVGHPHVMSDALLTSDDSQFYALVGERVIRSPVLIERKDGMGMYRAGATYLMRKGTFAVLYDDYGYVFDDCERVKS